MGGGREGRPTGTVAFLFTDVEGSTVLWERQPAAMRAALARHDQALREAIGAHDGFVFSTAGDSFSAAFWTAGDAAAAAVEAQRALHSGPWPDGVALRVRMGIHLGAAQERDGDYFGAALNRAARLMALAHGGQILVSQAVQQVLDDDLPDAVTLVGLGEHRLRGLSRPEQVFQVGAPALPEHFEPLSSEGRPTGNLPLPPTSFVGRVDELKQLAATVPTHRLVTLAGPGGVGKTRLAIETAAALGEEFDDGVWFVELAPVAGYDATLHAVASTLRLPPTAGSALLDSIVDGLAERRSLIVLDNCEHVVDAAADLAAAVGRGAPTVTVLATSREALGVAGERLWQVSPLDPRLEGVELFVERAAAFDSLFGLDDAEHEALGDLCAHLDGMPLAIELAASRARSLGVRDLAARLGDRFRLLRASRRRGIDERQQTLLATVEWSYRLLSADEQLLFDRLSVFAGEFDVDAAEAVCADQDLDRLDVDDLLDKLVDKSMVQTVRVEREVRFRLLETLRQYGHGRLAERGDLSTRRDRHLAHYVAVGGRARAWFEGSSNAAGRVLFEQSWDNLRAALDHAEDRDDASATQIVRDSFWYAWYQAREEHRLWIVRRLSVTDDVVLLGHAALWDTALGVYGRAEAHGRRAVDVAPTSSDPDTALSWAAISWAAWYTGRRELAWDADIKAKQLAARCPDRVAGFTAAVWMHPTAHFAPQDGPARAAAAGAMIQDLHNEALEAGLALHTGHAWFGVGEVDLALTEWRRAARYASISRTSALEGYALATLAIRLPDVGTDDPSALFREALERLHASRLSSYEDWTLAGLARWWCRHGMIQQAAHVVGFLDLNDPGGNQTYADVRAEATEAVQQHPDAATWHAAGQTMSRDEIVAYSLRHLDEPS